MKNTLRSALAVGTLLAASFSLAQVATTSATGQTETGESQITRPRLVETNTETGSPKRTIDNLDTANTVPEAATDKKAVKSTIAGSKGVKFQATTYCLKGITASGSGVRRGIIAADPRVLPLGSRVQITAGSYSGTYLVADTGGVIKGRIVDIWVPSCGEAKQFGRRTVYITRLGKK